MREAGFTHLNLSLVSADEASLLRVKRPHGLEKYLEVVEEAHALGFHIVSYQILGLPFETLEQMTDTLALLTRLPVLIGVSIFYLTPGSAMAREFPPVSEGDVVRARSTAMAMETGHAKREDLYSLFVSGRILNFLKGREVPGGRAGMQDVLHRALQGAEREKTGAELLIRLLEERRLYAATRQGLMPLAHFKAEHLLRVLEKAGSIKTLRGEVISPFS
jgi:radical SAM superfamily enzyme YgiQ (UPF0313 family)